MPGNRCRVTAASWRPDEGNHMKVTCVGTDPAALYFGILLKRKNPAHSIHFLENGSASPQIPASIVGNPLKPQLGLQDAAVGEEIGKCLATAESVRVSTPEKQFSATGFRYSFLDSARVIEVLEA